MIAIPTLKRLPATERKRLPLDTQRQPNRSADHPSGEGDGDGPGQIILMIDKRSLGAPIGCKKKRASDGGSQSAVAAGALNQKCGLPRDTFKTEPTGMAVLR